ncbi:MAG: hypothetical protein E6G68_08620 [Actinobacteria bacterium]|nr:MAG: hypothetical protein E6G68_08620 [Actinomycetota bacterium]
MGRARRRPGCSRSARACDRNVRGNRRARRRASERGSRDAVATFGDVARACGKTTGARAVGTILAAHPFEVPTHRVVDAAGRPSPAYGGGAERQLERLTGEGVRVEGGRVDLESARWRPG